MKTKYLYIITFILFLVSCGPKTESEPTVFTEDNYVNAIIEVPSGDKSNLNYDEISNTFDGANVKKANKYLSYVGNYGFITGTATNISEQGDGLPVDVLVLSKRQKLGKIVTTKPIALLKLVRNGKLDYKVISLPSKPSRNFSKVTCFKDLQTQHPEIETMVEMWFKNHDKLTNEDIVGWGNEEEAIAYIKANIKS
ncbi:inorganic diphosphatase [Neptunitalea lumnitzerae]|uniref:inorganic diphosphatase n=1 Tax=Neptunitalea lumnitzerae TaxID=2965509 RepID=A0ABQ5MHL1_9FLAO|nr:inorganic diphosphatase [Neptunitalea sp. Y10]GLB48879.1 hypothetical protein Y10_12470 [Neptunitalea sp. Y10]